MKVTLSFEKTSSSDVSIMVDVLRASTTITTALDKFSKIIPCFTPEEAFELKNKYNGVIAGERKGAKIEGFDIGNSPTAIKNFNCDSDILILTTSNGTRILENMGSKVLIGCLNNADAVADASLELAENHIDLVMAGVWENFAIEDFLAAGEIIYQISKKCSNCEISEYAKAAIFKAIVVGISILLKFMDSSILLLLTSIFLCCSMYQEYNAHAERLIDINEKLSKHWKNLFMIYLVAGASIGILNVLIVISLSAVFLQYAIVIMGVVLVLSGGFDFD